MSRFKKQDQWIYALCQELSMQAQKSFQTGVFEQIPEASAAAGSPDLLKALNNVLNCANLLLHHARENMTMLNRINHAGMWSMYFGENDTISRVVFCGEFRGVIGF